MIIVRLMGGLGNQMFQYAAGRALAMRHDTVLKLDLSFLQGSQEGNTRRCYLLDKLRISSVVADPSEIVAYEEGSDFVTRILRSVRKLSGQRAQRLTLKREARLGFDPAFFTFPDNILMVGYWQTDRYFRDVGDIIRNEFVPVKDLTGKSEELADMILGSNAVSIHIRRGDYASDPTINAVHGTCPMDYYHRCIASLLKRTASPHFFVFSDEPEWAEKHLKLHCPVTFVDHNTIEMPVEDLRLMSLCKHNIIANSSFSWWGAWLNVNPEKQIYAPLRWFAADDTLNTDMIPAGWERL